MFHSRRTISILLGILLVFLLVYCNIFNFVRFYTFYPITIKKENIINRLSPTTFYNGTEDFLINTPGCYIPNYSKTLRFKEATASNHSCGQRAVSVKKIADDLIVFIVDEVKLGNHSNGDQTVKCCYKFVHRSKVDGKEDTDITYSACASFHNGTSVKLEQEIVTVTCNLQPSNKTKIVYSDAYLIHKKIETRENNGRRDENSWNVLLLGMDTMSRARIFNSMPNTIKYLQQHKWLDYRGYQKVEYNTFPNLMAVLTGKNMSSVYKTCTKGMHKCNEFMMWSKFKDAGYVTAYGEDFLRLPDTFSRYNGFKIPPTDHYTRPFFLTGEENKGNLVCTQKLPSALHLLDYATQFTDAYKNENFFGMFWLNSYSHNLENLPTLIDNNMVSFFDDLNTTGVLDNTFVFFFSDHGIRFGDMRLPIESYYEERLPMLFIWVPPKFKELRFEEYYNLQINQNHLTTPYDLHMTLWNILKLSNNSIEVVKTEPCPLCTSLFEENSPYRTCPEAGVNMKWCSCYNMVKVDQNNSAANHSLHLSVSYIQNVTKTIETTNCNECSSLKLKHVLRNHSYRNEFCNKTYYVTAFEMTPGDVRYETTVEQEGNEFNVILPTHTISPYNIRGNCVKKPYDREFCVCSVLKNCNKKAKK